jgi:hypothetical protein
MGKTKRRTEAGTTLAVADTSDEPPSHDEKMCGRDFRDTERILALIGSQL